VNSFIIGVDLVPIKPIPKVVTVTEDITTKSCISTLKRYLKETQADVVLHDGAPNVGTSWTQDAFIQNELVISAFKLAARFIFLLPTSINYIFQNFFDLMELL
jgi:AdoMet-dependent rRNA methyltransferase SPB1